MKGEWHRDATLVEIKQHAEEQLQHETRWLDEENDVEH